MTVRYQPDSLEIEIDDERGPGRPAPIEPTHEGRGLVGMRERVAMFGGSLSAGATADRLPRGRAIADRRDA